MLAHTFTLLFLLTFVVVSLDAASASEEDEYRDVFTSWTHTHGKIYSNEEFLIKYATFKANYISVRESQSGGEGTSNFIQGLNEFSDLTFEEFSATHLGYNRRGGSVDSSTPTLTEEASSPSSKRSVCSSGSALCGDSCCPTASNYACVANSTECVSCESGSIFCGSGCCATDSGYVCTTSNQCVSCGSGFTTCPSGDCCPSRYSCSATGCTGAQIATGSPLSPTVNWTAQGYVTPVKNQGNCGSCWSFSTTGAVESAYNIKHKLTGSNIVSLSEQNLIDCSTEGVNSGCNGGDPVDGMQYVLNRGIDTESGYPLTSDTTGNSGTCAYNAAYNGAQITAYTQIKAGNETALQAQVAIQPVSVAICATDSLQGYVSGVFDDSVCGMGSTADINHAVLIVGYGTDPTAGAYWIVKNSWGSGWGMNGYFLLQKGTDRCGVAQQAVYPTSM